jgi:hypothetical protein
MNGRALQDELIRYLSDAKLRAASQNSLRLTGDEAEKANRFARFLARRYYRDRLIRSFRYSRIVTGKTGRRAEEICDREEFELFLDQCVLGSVDSARRAGQMAVAHLSPGQSLFPWWSELTAYEAGHLLQTATTERVQPGPRYQRSPSATCIRFEWALPEMLPRLRKGETPGEESHRGVTLLFSRTHMGKIYVVELDESTAAVFRATDGSRTSEQVAEVAGVTIQQAEEALSNLAQVGALEVPG